MKNLNIFKKEPDVEFYLMVQPNKQEQVVSAIGYEDGGYVYLSMPLQIKNFDTNTKLKISKIKNIVDLCGDPSVQVVSIDKDDADSKELYSKLLSCLKFNLGIEETEQKGTNPPEKQ